MLDIFKEIINRSSHPLTEENKIGNLAKSVEEEKKEGEAVVLKSRYVIAVILEFLRSLLEN